MTKANNLTQLKKEQAKMNLWGKLSMSKIKIVKKYAGKKILDVGCSKGENIYYLNKHGYDTYGCDLIKDPAWKGEYKNKFRIADIYKLPYKNKSFDTVISFEVFEHLKYPKKALVELFRVSKKNVILSVPNCEEPAIFTEVGITYGHYRDRTHINFFNKNELIQFIKSKMFKVTYIKKIDSIMTEEIIFYSWYFPSKLAVVLGKVFQRIPFQRKFYSDIVVVASR